MKKYPRLFLCVFLALLPSLSVWAMDTGLVLDQTVGFGGYGTDGKFDYSGMAIPRFSTLFGDNGSFFISAGFRADYSNYADYTDHRYKNWLFMPELLRTELNWRFGSGEITAGRMQYSDPLGFIADGLFDGARVSLDTTAGTFSVGAWYTGLLYKARANITMTDDELKSSNVKPDYAHLPNTYFAPRRIISALSWEHPGLGQLVRVNFDLLGQFDVSGGDYPLHTQYAVAKVVLPYNAFVFDLGGSFELKEVSGDLGIGLAGELGAAWTLPTSFESQLSFLGRFSSGVVGNSSMEAFLPVTTVEQGNILQAKLSGLSVLSLNYTARLMEALSAGISSSYFVRSDKATYSGYGNDGYFLGNEFFAGFLWNPLSEIQVNLGGGVFLPSMGNAAPDGANRWRIELNVILSLY